MNYIICGILCNLLISEHFFMVTTHNKNYLCFAQTRLTAGVKGDTQIHLIQLITDVQ